MPAYWIARSRIVEPVAYKKYTDRVPAIIARFDGKVLARGGKYRIWFLLDHRGGHVTSFEVPRPQICE